MRFWIALFMVVLLSPLLRAQVPADSLPRPNTARLATVIGTEALIHTGLMIGLNELWYKDFPRSPLHSFNDNREWLQMDKVGHAMTAYSVGLLGMESMRWAGLNERSSRWWGGATGWFFLSSVEVLDGYSEEWGFSWGDVASNTIGAGLLIGQDALWHEQRMTLKFSFRQSPYAKIRPNVLGEGWNEEVLKDYNGQTYWLSVNVHSFLKESSSFPPWLSLGLGYGIDRNLVGEGVYVRVQNGLSASFQGQRQFYIGPEIDLWRIKTKSKVLRTVFRSIGFIKLPLPALILQDGGLKMQGFRF